MKAWLEQYRRDHPMRHELLMAKARQIRRKDSEEDPDDGGLPPLGGRVLVERGADRFDHDVEPFGYESGDGGGDIDDGRP